MLAALPACVPLLWPPPPPAAVFSEELETGGSGPVGLLGCDACLCLGLHQAPEKLCWHPLLSEVILRPNTQCPFFAQCLPALLRLFIALNLIDSWSS